MNTRHSIRERSGSVVECLTRDRGAAGSSLIGVTVLWSLSKTHYPSLVLVQTIKTRPCLNERLLMGGKESNKKKPQGTQISDCSSTSNKTRTLDPNT